MTEPRSQPQSQPARPVAEAVSGGLAQAIGEQFSAQASVGGARGLLESVLPLTVFSVVYAFSHDLGWSVAGALIPAVALAGWRLAAREPLTQAVSGVLGIAIGAFLAVRTGHAQNIFLPSIIKNAAYGGAYALSVLVRWPLVGVLLGLMLGEWTHWRQVPARARVYALSTWVWAGMFGIRLAVQIPLWLVGAVTELALVNIALGLPLFGLVVWVTWRLVRRVPVARPADGADGDSADGDGADGDSADGGADADGADADADGPGLSRAERD